MLLPTWLIPIIVVVSIAIITAIVKVSLWAGAVNQDRKKFHGLITEIREDVKIIQDKIEEIFTRLPSSNQITTSTSPLSFTDFGETVAEDLDAHDWAVRVSRDVWEEVEKMEDYEVHEYCFDHIIDMST